MTAGTGMITVPTMAGAGRDLHGEDLVSVTLGFMTAALIVRLRTRPLTAAPPMPVMEGSAR